LAGASVGTSEWFKAQLVPVAGPEFTRRLSHHMPPPRVPLRLDHPTAGELRWHRETLELLSTDAQQIVVFLPAVEPTSRAVESLRAHPHSTLRAAT